MTAVSCQRSDGGVLCCCRRAANRESARRVRMRRQEMLCATQVRACSGRFISQLMPCICMASGLAALGAGLHCLDLLELSLFSMSGGH